MNLLAFAYDIDSPAYIAMAEGRWGEVWRPFANRVLGPMIARYTGFGLLQIVAGLFFFAAVFWLLKRRNAPPCRALPFLLAPWLVNFALNIYMPDLVTCALTAAVFAAYAGCGPFAAIVLLPFAVMARESSAVIALVWLCLLARDWICGRRSRWQIVSCAVCILAAIFVGMKATALISAGSPGNINGMGAFYLPVKAAVNGIFSITGLSPWNDVYARELPVFYTHAPLWKMACPAFLRLGRFTEIGIYEWHPWQALTTVKILLLGFGALVPYAILNWRTLNPRRFEGWLELAFWSGFAYWILTPICGFSPNRYVGYAWPLVWFAVLPSLAEERRRTYLIWLVAHLAIIGVCL